MRSGAALLSYLATARVLPSAAAVYRFLGVALEQFPGVLEARFEVDPPAPETQADAHPGRHYRFPVRYQGTTFATCLLTFVETPAPELLGDLTNACNLLALELFRRDTESSLQHEVAIRTCQLEDLLRQAKQRDASRMTFLANVSHELRTPINALVGFLDIMDTELYGPIGNSRYREYVSLLRTAARQLAHVVDGLLQLSSLSIDEAPLKLADTDLNGVIARVCALLEPVAARNKIRLLHPSREEGAFAPIDEAMIVQALNNIIGNALKFTPPGRTVEVVAAGAADLEDVTIAIIDEGPGIAPADLERVLRPFEQSHQVRPDQAGVGLGLPITARIVERHGGQLDFLRLADGRFQVTLSLKARGPLTRP